jgi:hypothetical protein
MWVNFLWQQNTPIAMNKNEIYTLHALNNNNMKKTLEILNNYLATIKKFQITDDMSKIEFKKLAIEIRQFIQSLELPDDTKSSRLSFIYGQMKEISRPADSFDENFKFDYFKNHMLLMMRSLGSDIDFYLKNRQ